MVDRAQESSGDRLLPRFAVTLEVEIVAHPSTRLATTLNVSMGGCCLGAAIRFECDSTLRLRIDLGGDLGILEVLGRVQWAAPGPPPSRHIAGIEFVDLSTEQRQALESRLAGESSLDFELLPLTQL